MVSPGEVARSLGSIGLNGSPETRISRWAAKVGLPGFLLLGSDILSFRNFFCMLG